MQDPPETVEVEWTPHGSRPPSRWQLDDDTRMWLEEALQLAVRNAIEESAVPDALSELRQRRVRKAPHRVS